MTSEHEAQVKLAAIAALDFGPRDTVAPGAAVRIGDRFLVVGVSTGEFTCQGQRLSASRKRRQSIRRWKERWPARPASSATANS